LENLKKRDRPNSIRNENEFLNIPILSSGRYPLSNALEYQKASTFLDVLLLLPFAPPYIHKLQLVLRIGKDCYDELLKLNTNKKTKKIYEEIIGKRHARYLFSSNGTVEIFVTSNDSPFRIETEEDEMIIFSFLGQVRDRLLYRVYDLKELYIPPLLSWILVQCDLNKDIKIDAKGQLTLPDIQMSLAGRVFRQYVKILNDKAFYRVEESLGLNEVLPEALENIRRPYRSLERKVDELPRAIETRVTQYFHSIMGLNFENKDIGIRNFQLWGCNS
jgi:hypothetical protein